jgi:transposase-like protein
MCSKEVLACPACGSSKVWKDGHHYSEYGVTQRYICAECGRKFR